jgi:hypothetical protein
VALIPFVESKNFGLASNAESVAKQKMALSEFVAEVDSFIE